MTKPFVLGLTGSMGMGKSTVAALFAARKIPVFDADAEVRRMQGPGGLLVAQIEAAFPGSTGRAGVERDTLGSIVFGDESALAQLEAIVHPAVRTARGEFLHAHGSAPLVVCDIPLLFEKGGANDVDAVAVVSAPPEVQRARVLDRPGMTPERFAAILHLQLPDEEKRARADFVIDTGGTLIATEKQVAALVEKLSR